MDAVIYLFIALISIMIISFMVSLIVLIFTGINKAVSGSCVCGSGFSLFLFILILFLLI